MAAPQSEDNGILRQWTPLCGLSQQIPVTVRRGLFLDNVVLTSIDAVPEYLVVGTNVGAVYWYNRETHSIQKLYPEVSLECLSNCKKVCLISLILFLFLGPFYVDKI